MSGCYHGGKVYVLPEHIIQTIDSDTFDKFVSMLGNNSAVTIDFVLVQLGIMDLKDSIIDTKSFKKLNSLYKQLVRNIKKSSGLKVKLNYFSGDIIESYFNDNSNPWYWEILNAIKYTSICEKAMKQYKFTPDECFVVTD